MPKKFEIRLSIKEQKTGEEYFSNVEPEASVLTIEEGCNEIFPYLEEKLKTMKVGDSATIALNSKDAFGDLTDEALINIPINEIPESERNVSNEVVIENDVGQQYRGIIQEINNDVAIVDFNHPLAGKDIEVSLTLIKVSELNN